MSLRGAQIPELGNAPLPADTPGTSNPVDTGASNHADVPLPGLTEEEEAYFNAGEDPDHPMEGMN